MTAPMHDSRAEPLSPFKRIFLEDSTQCSLNEKLADEFRGSGGSASRSSVKINLIYEFKNHTIQDISISSGNVPDQSSAEAIPEHIRADDLILRDLGYFATDVLGRIRDREAFYLSRLPIKMPFLLICRICSMKNSPFSLKRIRMYISVKIKCPAA
ncbi:IS4 family transposase [Desulfonema ishimotonii]|uniref:IS4 family transposase n=1 Tax=Desulfonema ishimotonii TaxID=45657 RepID=A0A401G025_9BACT|nr:IS4 family transposase [Desulfonema ishimotonii]